MATATLWAVVVIAARAGDESAFVQGMRLSSAIAAFVAVGLAILAVVVLRDRTAAPSGEHADAEVDLASTASAGGRR